MSRHRVTRPHIIQQMPIPMDDRERMKSREKWAWVLAIVFFIVSTSTLILWLRYFRDGVVDVSGVNNAISEGLREADSELMDVISHIPQVRERVVIVREEVASRILDTHGDELVSAALARAERYRSRIIASGDIQDARGISVK